MQSSRTGSNIATFDSLSKVESRNTQVLVNDTPVFKAGTLVSAGADLRIKGAPCRFASRCRLASFLADTCCRLRTAKCTGIWSRRRAVRKTLAGGRCHCEGGSLLDVARNQAAAATPHQHESGSLPPLIFSTPHCRAGLKLDAALEHFGVDVNGLTALDASVSWLISASS